MNEIKPGTGKRPYTRRASSAPKYDPADEAQVVVAKRAPKVEHSDAGQVPTRVVVRPSHALKAIVPGHVWKQTAFKWDPLPFGPESERLNERVIEPRVQNQSLLSFLEDVREPIIYGVSGNPDDAKAKYFAAYLVAAHLEKLGSKANVVWHTLYGGFSNSLLTEYDPIDGKADPTLLVLSNLTPASTNVKLEKARDLLERFSDIPRIVVIAGEDPLSFLTTRLYSPINALAYFSETLMKRRMEIF